MRGGEGEGREQGLGEEGEGGPPVSFPCSVCMHGTGTAVFDLTSLLLPSILPSTPWCSRFLERTVKFILAANEGLQNVGQLPSLILISNKKDVSDCETDIKKTTDLFERSMGSDYSRVEPFFKQIIAMELPNRRTVDDGFDTGGARKEGEAVYRMQMTKLKVRQGEGEEERGRRGERERERDTGREGKRRRILEGAKAQQWGRHILLSFFLPLLTLAV